MPSRVNKFKLGLFVLIGFSLALIALIWIGASEFFHKKATYVSYFQESVKGLQKGATVNYRGVGIGRVADIRLAPDGRLIEVVMNLDPSFCVDDTLCVRLREQGLTGLRFLEIDTKPPGMKEYTPKISFKPPYPVIPAYPSEIQQLKAAMEIIYQKILAVDVEGISEKLNKFVEEALKLIRNENWPEIITQIKNSTASFQSIARKIDEGTNPEDINKLVKGAVKTLQSIDSIVETVQKEIKSKEFKAFMVDLREGVAAARDTFVNLSTSSDAFSPERLKEISDGLRRIVLQTNEILENVGQDVKGVSGELHQGLIELTKLLKSLEILVDTLRSKPNVAVFGTPTREPFK